MFLRLLPSLVSFTATAAVLVSIVAPVHGQSPAAAAGQSAGTTASPDSTAGQEIPNVRETVEVIGTAPSEKLSMDVPAETGSRLGIPVREIPASVTVVASEMLKGTSRMRANVRASSVLPLPVGPSSRTLLFSISTSDLPATRSVLCWRRL